MIFSTMTVLTLVCLRACRFGGHGGGDSLQIWGHGGSGHPASAEADPRPRNAAVAIAMASFMMSNLCCIPFKSQVGMYVNDRLVVLAMTRHDSTESYRVNTRE